MQTVKASIGREHYKTILQSDTNQIMADEPKELGGTDLGFSPDELMAASLAACTAITLRMYADRKQFPLDHAEVEVTVHWDKQERKTLLRKTLRFTGDLTAEQRQRLREIADKCPTHVAMLSPISIQTELL
jgi:putative redox protein